MSKVNSKTSIDRCRKVTKMLRKLRVRDGKQLDLVEYIYKKVQSNEDLRSDIEVNRQDD